jgi:tetratricopeptide (TPR) repeat protein
VTQPETPSESTPTPITIWRDLFAATVILTGVTVVALYLALRWVEFTRVLQPTPEPALLIESLRRTGRPVQALYLVESDARYDGWTPERLRLAGDLWREIGDWYAAAAFWERARAFTPDDRALLSDLAETYVQVSEWTRASDVLALLHQLTPDDAWVAFQLGLIRASIDADSESLLRIAAREPAYAAIVDPVRSVLSNPELSSDQRALQVGITLAQHGEWAYAELAFGQAAPIDAATEALALAYGGWARVMQGKDGSSAVRRALAIAPDDARLHMLHGLVLRERGDLQASLLAIEQAVRIDPSRPAAYAELGVAHWLIGDRITAEYWLRTALDFSEGDPRYHDLLDALLTEERDLLSELGIELESFLQGE